MVVEGAEHGQRPLAAAGRLVSRAYGEVQFHPDEQGQGLTPVVTLGREADVSLVEQSEGVRHVGSGDALHREQRLRVRRAVRVAEPLEQHQAGVGGLGAVRVRVHDARPGPAGDRLGEQRPGVRAVRAAARGLQHRGDPGAAVLAAVEVPEPAEGRDEA